VADKHGVPILGQGGLTTPKDALEFAITGATALGLGTGLFYDPLLCPKMLSGLSDYLSKHDMASYQELVGSLQV